jgi:VWFA-related protein
MRSRRLALAAVVLALGALPVAGQGPGGMDYKVEIEPNVYHAAREKGGKSALYVTLRFRLLRAADNKPVADLGPDDTLLVEEDRRPVADLEIFGPKTNALTTALALDISGSMSGSHKIEGARQAAEVFLDRLDPGADCGLILFDHKMRLTEPPVRDRARVAAHREELRRHIRAAQPMGGTAYLDATAQAVEMLRDVPGRKAVLLMTDGVDLNSQQTLAEVIRKARAAGVPVYALGVGEPGRNEPVHTVLVLDHSGSMSEPADTKDNVSKIKALHQAAGRFVDIMRRNAETTLLPFSTRVERPEPFSHDKAALKDRIDRLVADGGTLLYDATYEAIEVLEAARPAGKRAVVVLTDGVDEAPGSRHRVEEVIARARETKVPLYMLGLGRPEELNQTVMRRMADETHGQYYHASNQQALFDLFEKLSIDLHDEGIDEAALKALAEGTGGRYIPARDVSKLHEIYKTLADELQSSYTVTFPSRRSSHDGTARGIDVSVQRHGVRVSNVGSADYNVRGVVVPEMDHRVYFGLLAVLAGLLGLPVALRRLYRFYGG